MKNGLYDSYNVKGVPLTKGALLAILDSLVEGVAVINCEGRIVFWNAAMERLTSRSLGEALGRTFAEVFGADVASKLRRYALSPRGAASPPMGCESMFPEFTGAELSLERGEESVPVKVDGRWIREDGGRVAAMVLAFSDLSPVKRVERELKIARDNLRRRYSFGRIVGRSKAMQHVFSLIESAAEVNTTVLITGESGTGKELVAAAIHYNSPRRDRPFIKVNCAALSESLLESELFGHVKGAFTGAISSKPGRFELADGGTILLDEIGELGYPMQTKLLRVLQEKEFERVGGTRTIKVDVRVIAATNKNLMEEMLAGRFREDLYYRLKVFPIHMPPLRERREDIEPLVYHFIEKFNERTGKGITGLSPEAWQAVEEYCWPGNVRELENAIEHAFVLCPKGGTIGFFDLPVEIRQVEYRQVLCNERLGWEADPRPRGGRAADAEGTVEVEAPAAKDCCGEDPKRILADSVKLRRLLERFGWNMAEAARFLGVHRSTVLRRARRHGLVPPGG